MKEKAQTIEKLRNAAASINAAAGWLCQKCLVNDNSTQEPAKVPGKKEAKPKHLTPRSSSRIESRLSSFIEIHGSQCPKLVALCIDHI